MGKNQNQSKKGEFYVQPAQTQKKYFRSWILMLVNRENPLWRCRCSNHLFSENGFWLKTKERKNPKPKVGM